MAWAGPMPMHDSWVHPGQAIPRQSSQWSQHTLVDMQLLHWPLYESKCSDPSHTHRKKTKRRKERGRERIKFRGRKRERQTDKETRQEEEKRRGGARGGAKGKGGEKVEGRE